MKEFVFEKRLRQAVETAPPFERALYLAWRESGLVAAPRLRGGITFCCPACEHVLDVIEGVTTCNECGWGGWGAPAEIVGMAIKPASIASCEDSPAKMRLRKRWEAREGWPYHGLRTLGPKEGEEFGRMFGVDRSAAVCFSREGFLRVGNWGSLGCCFVFKDGPFAELWSRWRSKEFPERNVNGVRAVGSAGHFFCRTLEQRSGEVILVVGAPALLQTSYARSRLYSTSSWLILAATGEGSRFSGDPEQWEALANRRVRVVINETPGQREAARVWFKELKEVGCDVSVKVLEGGWLPLLHSMDREQLRGVFE